MEEDSNNSQDLIVISESNIRVIESNIQAHLSNFEKKVSDMTFIETSNVCDNVRDQILDHEDEPHLSKTQNNCRRIYIASELFISICSIYGRIVDNEFSKIINDMVQWEKYRKLSKKILHKMRLDKKKEKYFAKEAESKLLKSLEETESRNLEERETEAERREPTLRPSESSELISELREDADQAPVPMEITEQILIPVEGMETEEALATISEKESPPERRQPAERKIIPGYDINETLALPLDSTSMDDIISSISANLTEMRAERTPESSRLQYPISTISRQDLSLPGTVADISVREPAIQEKTDDDISHILQILEEQISQKEVVDIPPLIQYSDKGTEVAIGETIEELQTEEKRLETSETSEEWNLPSLEPAEKTRKRTRLIIDKVTIIPDYAARALHLNRNINVQRVQVFEGPPNILQEITANNLMRTPGFKSSLFQDVRSSKLNALYNRHLEVEKKPVEPVLPRRVIEKKRDDVSKSRTTVEIVEVGERVGMRSVFEKSDLLAEIAPDKSRLEDLEISAVGAPQKESLIGVPVSRIISSKIEPPEEVQMERINAAPLFFTPGAQQLQGKSLDPITSSSWFFSSKQNPPSGKYREFDYIFKKLKEYWSLLEIQGSEKCITLREFFSFEEDACLANYLTALRIVDKLSIQRKLFLEYKNNDVFIRPFERPYVSEGQMLLKEREPLF